MPKLIITRFLVAVHYLIEKQQLVWRNRVILYKDETRAEVIEIYDARKIFIRVSGKNRRDLMTIITNELDKIHNSYGDRLKVDKLIPCNCETCQNNKVNNKDPYFHRFDNLRNLLAKSIQVSQCQISGDLVNIYSLIDDSIGRDNFSKNTDNNPQIIQNIRNYAGSHYESKSYGSGDANAGKEVTNKSKNLDVKAERINTISGDITGENANVVNSSGDNTTFDLSRAKTTGLTVEDITSLIKALADAISGANLPESDTKRLKRNVLTVNAELAEDEPDKEEIEGRLEAITNPINTLSTTLEAAKQLKEQVEPVIEKILA